MDSFLQELAQARPDPGGGAATAFGARLGLALLEKVMKLEGGRQPKRATESALNWEKAELRLRDLSESLEKLQAEDVRAYSQLVAARASGEDLTAAVRQAVQPLGEIVKRACEGLELLAWTGGHCKAHLVSDLLVACEFLGAALMGAYHITCANLRLTATVAHRQGLRREFCQAYQKGEDLYHMVKAALVAREDGFDSCR